MKILNHKGSVLLFAIVAITIMAILGTGIYFMTTTATFSGLGANQQNRAYQLAVAGKDYALAKNLPDTIILYPSGRDFTFANGDKFKLVISGGTITSTGIINEGTPYEAKQTIKSVRPAKRHFLDTFDDTNLPNWDKDTQIGTHEVSPDNALHVTGTGMATWSNWSILQLKSTDGGGALDITTSWKNAGYCLAYDLQVKISNSEPLYMTGLTFKNDKTGNEFYGVSYLRAKQSTLDIPIELIPPAIKNEKAAIVLWNRQGGTFTWLAYKLLTSDDFVVDEFGNLVAWANLQVRLIEAYPLEFTNGGPALLHNAIIKGKNSGAIARISGTPIIKSGSLSDNSAEGILTLSNWNGTQFQNEDLTTGGTSVKATALTPNYKKNYIRVYYSDDNGANNHGTPNNSSIDNIRRSNPRLIAGSNNTIHWPVDNVSHWKDINDYMTLVTWDGINPDSAIINPPELLEELLINSDGSYKLSKTIIRDNSLLTPDSGNVINNAGIALHATGSSADSTYFDDFAVQY